MNYKEFFEENGYLIIENIIDNELLNKYEEEWDKDNLNNRTEFGLLPGWSGHSSYLEHDSIKDILCNEKINNIFEQLGRGLALHSSRTFGTSTEMPWHHDSVLPNDIAADNYIGVWVAVEDVSEESGPFEFIPGSHKWELDFKEVYSLEEIGSFKGDYGNFDISSEIEKRNVEPILFMAKKGDIIIWHGRLVHRGRIMTNRSLTRKALIGHYCNGYANIDATEDAATPEESIGEIIKELNNAEYGRFAQWKSGGYYFK